MWSTPSSTARRRTASAASRSRGGPNTPGPASCMAPNPIRPTSWLPSLAVRVVGACTRGCATVGRVTRRASIVGLAPPPSQERRSELTDFLRNRRAQVTPQDVGLPANGRRRTPGLRREEVAQLAGVGLSWYTWLEQGRDIKPSAQVLDALARVLRLDTAERAHLFHLARVELPLPAGDYPREAPPDLAHFVERVAPYPAYLIGPRTDVLAWNAAATAMLGEPTRAPDGRQNLLWWLFTAQELRHRAAPGAPLAARSRASAPSRRAASATPTSPRSSTPSTRPASSSARGGRATRCSPSSSERRPSSTRASAASCSTTCSRRRRATRTCGSSSSRPPTRRRGTRSPASSNRHERLPADDRPRRPRRACGAAHPGLPRRPGRPGHHGRPLRLGVAEVPAVLRPPRRRGRGRARPRGPRAPPPARKRPAHRPARRRAGATERRLGLRQRRAGRDAPAPVAPRSTPGSRRTSRSTCIRAARTRASTRFARPGGCASSSRA